VKHSIGIFVLAVVAVASCSPRFISPGPTLPQAMAVLGKCHVAASHTNPLVTEWPGSEKANLEVMLRSGAVAVAYSGCTMRLLPECRVRGKYRWQRTTPASDNLEINNEDELYARLPLGAASLEGELKRAGKLTVQTIVSGQLKLEEAGVADVAADGACAGATHLVSSLTVGAFALTSGASASGKAGASVASLGEAGGSTNRSAQLMRSAGDPAVCGSGTEEAPHPNCASPVQVFLRALPGRAAEEGPPGTVKVDFVSANPASRWDVYADDEVICTTPCVRWVNPTRPVMLRTREGGSFMSSSDRVQVANLLGHSGYQHLQLQAHGTSNAKLATGITFTALTGMAVISGISLTALGCSRDRSSMCTGGIITMGVGALGLVGGIYLILDSASRAEVTTPDPSATTFARRRLRIGPGFLMGTF
jgi:hypothetical protein